MSTKEGSPGITVVELMGILGELMDDGLADALIIISKDGEGNSFSPLADGASSIGVYVPDTTYSGEFYSDDDESDEEEDEGREDGIKCVCLRPIN